MNYHKIKLILSDGSIEIIDLHKDWLYEDVKKFLDAAKIPYLEDK